MNSLLRLTVVWLTFAGQSVVAQKSVDTQELLWFSYFNRFPLDSSWTVVTDVQERVFQKDFVQHTLLLRSQVTRTLLKGWETGVGFCIFLQHPHDPEILPRQVVPELRPHIELAQKQIFGLFQLQHRVRCEARFFHNTTETEDALLPGYTFKSYRFRFRLQVSHPIWRRKQNPILTLKGGNEILLQAGKEIVSNPFDQNRWNAAVQWHISPTFLLETGYIRWYQQRSNGTSYFDRHILQIALHHQIHHF